MGIVEVGRSRYVCLRLMVPGGGPQELLGRGVVSVAPRQLQYTSIHYVLDTAVFETLHGSAMLWCSFSWLHWVETTL